MTSRLSPTGAQWTISHGDQQAVVVEVGGGLRSYEIGGVPVLAGFRADQACVSGRGQVLAPWPNRLRDGKYTIGGVAEQLSLTEVARHNASHGLVRWALWELVRQEADTVEVRYRLHPQPGWRWFLDLGLVYALGDDGLQVTVSAHNRGDEPAPFGFAQHPYVATVGTEAAQVRLSIPGGTYMQVDPERLLPTGTASVDGTEYDFRQARELGETSLDTAYTDLAREGERWRVIVAGGPIGPVAVWGGPGLDWVQVFSEKAALPADGDQVPGVAVEPMSCPADAFNSGTDLAMIAPGQTWQAQWGVSAYGGGNGEA